MNQEVQEIKMQVRRASTIGKAYVIAASRRIHKSSQGSMWIVEGSQDRKFYKVEYVSGEMICECPAFTYGMTVPCKHILSIAMLNNNKEAS